MGKAALTPQGCCCCFMTPCVTEDTCIKLYNPGAKVKCYKRKRPLHDIGYRRHTITSEKWYTVASRSRVRRKRPLIARSTAQQSG